jgi:hypothetical protein
MKKEKYYSADGFEIEGTQLFAYASYAIRCRTDRQYRKLISEENGTELDLDEAHEEHSTTKKILRLLNKIFSDETILEVAELVV